VEQEQQLLVQQLLISQPEQMEIIPHYQDLLLLQQLQRQAVAVADLTMDSLA